MRLNPVTRHMMIISNLSWSQDQEHFKESCPAEQPSWSSGTSSVSPPSELGLTPPLPHNTTSKEIHLSMTGAEINHHEEHRPETQDQDHRTAPTGEFELKWYYVCNTCISYRFITEISKTFMLFKFYHSELLVWCRIFSFSFKLKSFSFKPIYQSIRKDTCIHRQSAWKKICQHPFVTFMSWNI